ncbi:hypothetical protein [Burkholderia sp. Bp9015]|uniref:hypothetical protein n=1 Tax=Burkholderia sp. Bp9015 TaxID=2184563 RepID=UPI000F5AF0D0|nr:hypothetical protein [Burkholderia sp. Bp9015]RQR60704.1 hypothetical protein DIE12_36780 [Burkholderia sp. Bp9015]
MQIPCTITRELFPDRDRAGRPYTVEFVHYADAATGSHVRTKANIIRVATTPHQHERSGKGVESRRITTGRLSDSGNVYLDATENPAIRISVAYYSGMACASHVLAVRDGRVVTEWIGPEEFADRFRECSVPPLIAARALDSVGRFGGIDAEAHRYLLFALGAPAWRIALNTYESVVRDRWARLVRHFI